MGARERNKEKRTRRWCVLSGSIHVVFDKGARALRMPCFAHACFALLGQEGRNLGGRNLEGRNLVRLFSLTLSKCTKAAGSIRTSEEARPSTTLRERPERPKSPPPGPGQRVDSFQPSTRGHRPLPFPTRRRRQSVPTAPSPPLPFSWEMGSATGSGQSFVTGAPLFHVASPRLSSGPRFVIAVVGLCRRRRRRRS